MSRINLKNIFSKKADAQSLLPAVIESMHQNVWIEDDSGKLLAGTQNTIPDFSYPVQLDEEILGWVKGDGKGKIVADLLMFLLQKEK